MDSKLSDEAMASLLSGFADRISLSGSSVIPNILAELGPSCTRSPTALRDVLADVSRTHGAITESSLASIIFFFSDKRNAIDSGTSGLSSSLMGGIVAGRNMDNSSFGWNLETVLQVISEDYSSFNWDFVAQNWDFPEFRMVDTNQFRTLVEMYRAGAKKVPPLAALTRHWRNPSAQFSLLEAMVASPPSVYTVSLNEEEMADAAVAPTEGPTLAPNPDCWASMEILQRLLHLSDVPALYRPVRDLFVRCLLSCPEVLFCSLVRLQLHVANTASSQPGGDAAASAGRQLKTELMRELIPLFFRPNPHHRVHNGPPAIRRLYAISPTTVMAACFEAWRSVAQDSPQIRLAGIFHIINIARLLPSPADAVASLLSGNKDAEYSISIAFVMSDNDFLQLKPWLGEKLTSKGSAAPFAFSLVSYLRKTYAAAKPRVGGADGPLVSLENIVISLQLLESLEASVLAQPVVGSLDRVLATGTLGENVKSLMDACLTAHPSLRVALSGQNPPTPLAPLTSSEDVEDMATAYFQKIYTSEQSIGDVVEMLKRFKTSGNSKENEIFACMVHNLFNEYRFFNKYPEKELRITGILFGALIQEQLVSSITLGIALRYVLEALRKPPETTSTGKMFKFGMFALEQFKGRLHEWPQYCSHIVQIPHLKEKYAELVAEIESEMNKSQSRGSGNSVDSQSSGGGTIGKDLPSVSSVASMASATSAVQQLTIPTNEAPRVAVFGEKLGRAVTDNGDEERVLEAPTDTILDKVQFLVNNLAPANVEKKAQELKEMLDPQYFDWLGHYLVVKRISTQANFHSLYLAFLDSLGDYGKGLVEAILRSVYHNIGKLLRSSKITTSSSERSYLKNLGIWLGQITLARNRPILQVTLDCKELLLQGYETGKLIAVAPFLAKTLEGAKNSKVFRPPNPWLMGILGVFRSVYNVQGLKMNIKFEVEVLCKNLGIRLEDIPLRNEVLALRVAPAKNDNPDFNIKTTMTAPKISGNTAKGSPGPGAGLASPLPDGANSLSGPGQEQLETVIPNLASYVTVNPSLIQLIQTQGGATLSSLVTSTSFKRWVPIAVDRAIREIIQPVVERSVTIACITTKEIVTKDFAMESDEAKLRKAGQLMVANLAGSLALVTCREPLRSSISSHLRQLLTAAVENTSKLGEQEQTAIEQCVQICSTDNLELGCRLIEKAATEKAVRDVDEALAPAITARRSHREQTGQPYFDSSIFAGGTQRYPSALPEALRPKPGGLREEHFQLYESFQRLPRSGTPVTGGSALPPRVENQGITKDPQTPQKAMGQQFSAEVLASISTKLDSVVNALLSAAGARSGEIKLAMLPPDHQVKQLIAAIKQVIPNSTSGNISRPLSAPEQEMILAFSQGIFKRLYDLSLKEPLRLEVLVALMENINIFCPKLGKDLGTWVTYAPTNSDVQRRLHKTVLLLLLRSRLLAVQELDSFLAARADNGRNHVWVEFSLYLIRTAFVESISNPSDFPKLIDLMTRIVDNRSQANQQVVQAYRKQILRMLEETRSLPDDRDRISRVQSQPFLSSGNRVSLTETSSLSNESLEKLSVAPKLIADATTGFVSRDPSNAKQQVTVLLDGWMRIQADGLRNENTISQFLQVLEQYGFGKNEEKTERFLRLSVTIIVEAVLKSASPDGDKSRAPLNFSLADMYCRLLCLLFRRVKVSGSQDQLDTQRLGMLNKILGVLVRTMVWHSEKWKVDGNSGPWDQRPWYRLFLNLMVDLNKPSPELESIRLGVLSIFGAALHASQPLVMPGKFFSALFALSNFINLNS
jgi:CCR4-NOT transcription complex subunit 1